MTNKPCTIVYTQTGQTVQGEITLVSPKGTWLDVRIPNYKSNVPWLCVTFYWKPSSDTYYCDYLKASIYMTKERGLIRWYGDTH